MLFDKTKMIKQMEGIERSDSDKLKEFFSKRDNFLKINKIMIFAIFFSIFSFYSKGKYLQLKSQIVYLFLNTFTHLLSLSQNKSIVVFSQILLVQGNWLSTLFISEDLKALSKINPIDTTKYISLTFTVSIIYYSLTQVKKNYVLMSLICNMAVSYFIQLNFQNSELFLERISEEYGLILFLFFVTFYNRDKIAEMESQILVKENLQRSMANFYNQILDRTINYHLLVYNNKERIFLNKSFNYLIAQCKNITNKASFNLNDYTEKDIDDVLELMIFDSNYCTSFKKILDEVLLQKESNNNENDKIIFNGKFSFKNLLYFDIYIRKSFYTENFNPLQIEIYDITAYKEAENKIIEEMDKKQKVFGRIIHEFKTPLIAVSTLAKKVKDDINDQSKIEEIRLASNQIENITSYISFLISDFIQLSKNENQLSVELTQINLEEICGFCINILKSILEIKNKDSLVSPCLIYDKAIKNYFIFCDEVRLKQMLLNFLSNAAKFTKHGKIELICSIDYKLVNKSIQIPNLKIIINDTGLGMSKEQLDIINKKKYDNIKIDRKINEFGTGLGISITHQIAEALNMDMSINSIEGKGTTVMIDYFNIKDKNDNNAIIYSPKSARSSSRTLPFLDAKIEDPYLFNNPLMILNDNQETKCKILIADDSLFVRNPVVNLFMKVLKSKGLYLNYEIIQCGDGLDVIKEIIKDQKERKIKLILSDNEMEYFNGGETLRILKNLYLDRRISQVPYSICFTADTTKINVDSLLTLGFNRVIEKEMKVKDVENIIDNLTI